MAVEECDVFKEPGYSYFFWGDHGEVPAGTLMTYVAETNGYYEVDAEIDGEVVRGYVFRGEATLVDRSNPSRVIRPGPVVGGRLPPLTWRRPMPAVTRDRQPPPR